MHENIVHPPGLTKPGLLLTILLFSVDEVVWGVRPGRQTVRREGNISPRFCYRSAPWSCWPSDSGWSTPAHFWMNYWETGCIWTPATPSLWPLVSLLLSRSSAVSVRREEWVGVVWKSECFSRIQTDQMSPPHLHRLHAPAVRGHRGGRGPGLHLPGAGEEHDPSGDDRWPA